MSDLYNEEIAIHHKLTSNNDIDEFLKLYLITLVEKSIESLCHKEKSTVERFYSANKYTSANILSKIKNELRVDKKFFSDPKIIYKNQAL